MVGDKIKLTRQSLGLTQQKLADMIGISRIEINKIENNKAPNLRAGTAFSIAKALKVSMDFLFCDECLDNEPEND